MKEIKEKRKAMGWEGVGVPTKALHEAAGSKKKIRTADHHY